MDAADAAQRDSEAIERLSERFRAHEPEAKETGYCLTCGAPLPKGRRWCDAECRDEWEREQKRIKANQ
jgi:hypothetical protein